MVATHHLVLASAGGPTESFLTTVLTDQGYAVEVVEGLDALVQRLDQSVDLLLLNVFTLQDLVAVEEVRNRSTCAIIVLGPPRSAQMLITALERGADDYVQRPFRTDELLARIRARLRRLNRGGLGELQLGPLSLDLRTRTATLNGQMIELSSFELLLLATLAAHPGQKYRAAALLEQIWGARRVQDIDLLQTAIHHLRLMIEHDPAMPEILCGDVRRGYWLSFRTREVS